MLLHTSSCVYLLHSWKTVYIPDSIQIRYKSLTSQISDRSLALFDYVTRVSCSWVNKMVEYWTLFCRFRLTPTVPEYEQRWLLLSSTNFHESDQIHVWLLHILVHYALANLYDKSTANTSISEFCLWLFTQINFTSFHKITWVCVHVRRFMNWAKICETSETECTYICISEYCFKWSFTAICFSMFSLLMWEAVTFSNEIGSDGR